MFEEEFIPSEVDEALGQAAQGGCGVSFKTRLDKVLYSLLWVTLLRQEGWTG